ncbi:MAG: radical SAM protein [Candidatus Diapherotrites archaeon]
MEYDLCLIFPPVWYAEYPYLSTAALKAYLEGKGFKVLQKDLNIGFFQKLKKSEEVKPLYDKAREYLRKHETGYGVIGELKEKIGKKDFEEFREDLAANNVPFDFFSAIVSLGSFFNEASTEVYHDPLFSSVSLSDYAVSLKGLKKIVGDNKNRFLGLREEIKCIKSSNFAITVVALNQVVAAFTIARLIKEETNSRVFLGGPWATQLNKKLLKKEVFDFFDVVCFSDGENVLSQLLEGQGFESVPGIAFRKCGKIIWNKAGSPVDINSLPTPSFDDLPLGEYFYPKMFPLQTSKSCYWARCVYCSYPVIEGRYIERGMDLVVSDIKNLVKKYGAEKIMFADSCLKPRRLEELSKRILREGINIKFGAYARFDKGFSKETFEIASKAGLKELCWGLESGSGKVLKKIRKGFLLEEAEKILKEAKSFGIHSRVFFMYDLPCEERKDFEKTLEFFKKNQENISSFCLTRYVPEINTAIEKEAKNLGIKLKYNRKKNLCLAYDYLHSLKEKDIEEIAGKFN